MLVTYCYPGLTQIDMIIKQVKYSTSHQSAVSDFRFFFFFDPSPLDLMIEVSASLTTASTLRFLDFSFFSGDEVTTLLEAGAVTVRDSATAAAAALASFLRRLCSALTWMIRGQNLKELVNQKISRTSASSTTAAPFTAPSVATPSSLLRFSFFSFFLCLRRASDSCD